MPFVWSPLPDELPPTARRLVVELRALKDARGLSFQEIGRLTHYSRASWERWLNGKRPVSRPALESLLAALGTDSGRLLQLLDETEQAAAAPRPPLAEAPDAAEASRRLAQLPAVVADFVGRTEKIDGLAEVLLHSCGAPGQVPIAVLTGGGGYGKTALALQVAHSVARHFPDGQLHADLRGTGPAPRDPAEVLAGWLRDLGQMPESLPDDLDARAARFRSLLAGKHCLVVLDDALDAAQVGPLLPGSRGSAVLITSRNRLASPPGAVREHLEELPAEDARCLFGRIVGASRVAAEPAAADAILTACGGLPLAVRLAATRLANRPEWSLAHLAEALEGEAYRPEMLQVEPLGFTRLIDGEGELSAARALRLLSLFPAPELPLPAAAALLGMDPCRTRGLLEQLVDASLLGTVAPDRYRMHDLLRACAREYARRDLAPADQLAASRRVIRWYAHTAEHALALIRSRPTHVPLEPEPPLGLVSGLADSEQAVAWCSAERANLAAVIRLAFSLGRPVEARVLATALRPWPEPETRRRNGRP
ncbi:helix-turn-helix domain-containing protein [Kitasatospora sp. RB6PN24]|uniref:XRE family transcriptional regulator n=1 Tax=Kitasatospora humi TaxID=2893891 RepID=UPI001E5D7019|nr:XRE family transcriptional regulator [Kitasatospora humi]MCC9308328.1 helix-turn-helix domain-containing protein [Kitasatospora humi]